MFKTDRDEKVYQFIWSYVTLREAPPSYAQIAEAVNLTKAEVSQSICSLRAEGRIEAGTLLPTAYDRVVARACARAGSYLALRQS